MYFRCGNNSYEPNNHLHHLTALNGGKLREICHQLSYKDAFSHSAYWKILLKDGLNDVSYAIIYQGRPYLGGKCLLLASVIDVESIKKALRGNLSDLLDGEIDSVGKLLFRFQSVVNLIFSSLFKSNLLRCNLSNRSMMCVCACFNISECIVVVERYCCVFVTSANAKQSMDEWMDGHCSLSHSPMTYKADRSLHLSSRTQKANIHILHQKKVIIVFQ